MAARNINDQQRQQWVQADPSLALLFAQSRLGMRDFVVANRAIIDERIKANRTQISAQGWQVPPPSMLTTPLPKAGRPKGGKGGARHKY